MSYDRKLCRNFTLPLDEANARELFRVCPEKCKKDAEKMLALFRGLASDKFDPVVEYSRNKMLEVARGLPEPVLDWFRDRNGLRGNIRTMCKFIKGHTEYMERTFSIKIDNIIVYAVQDVLTRAYMQILEETYACKDEKDYRVLYLYGETHLLTLHSLTVSVLSLHDAMPKDGIAKNMRNYICASVTKELEDQISTITTYYNKRGEELVAEKRANQNATVPTNVGAAGVGAPPT